MMTLSKVFLVEKSPEACGVGMTQNETIRKRNCQVKSVGQTETYQAKAAGLNPEVKIKLFYEGDYHGEQEVIFRGERWDVVRTFVNEKENGIELTLQRKERNKRGNAW